MVVQVVKVEQHSENVFQVTLSVDGQIKKHLLTVATPIRVVQAGSDMNQYSEAVHIEVYQQIATLQGVHEHVKNVHVISLTGMGRVSTLEE
jgi:hypothetical protein